LISDIAIGQDADFSEERLIERYNADLANSLGNLLNRTLSMLQKYRGSRAKKITSEAISKDVNTGYADFIKEYQQAFDLYEINAVVESLQSRVDFFNRFIESHAPWALAKSTTDSDELDEVLYDAAESLRILGILISPVLPKSAHGIFDQLNWKMELTGKEERFSLADAEWGGLTDGHVVGKPVPLFPRIER
jgi:methionyl-tRNA synthetase